jgi:hypothetical protein
LFTQSKQVETTPAPFAEFVSAVWGKGMYALDVFVLEFLNGWNEVLVR